MTRRRTRHGMAVAAMALMVAVAACGGDPASSDPTTSPASPSIAQNRPTSTGELTIVSPENGERISGDTAQLEIDLRGAEVVDQTSTDLRTDEGHLHFVLDGKLVSMTSGTSQLLQGLTPGEHLVQVEFVAKDHAPFDPRVLAAATFEVKS